MQRAYYPIHQKSEAIPSLFYAYNKTARVHRSDRLQLLGESNPNLRSNLQFIFYIFELILCVLQGIVQHSK